MRVLVATDAWRPQVNGVVRTYEQLSQELTALGVDFVALTPNEYRTIACPGYAEIRLAVPGYSQTARRIRELSPDAIHIATEGPIGWMTRHWCLSSGVPFTTSFHTRFPEYIHGRLGVPTSPTYALLRRFHNASTGMMVAASSLARELERRGFRHVVPWTRGVDTSLFQPRPLRLFGSEPVHLYVGRIAVEKNIEAFLTLDLPGRKVVVGSGPELERLRARYPGVLFTGRKAGDDLAACYASADVLVFPSRTDTFGIVLLEAMASGLPVAAYPVTGPIDVVEPGVTGVLDDDLAAAIRGALRLDRSRVRAAAQGMRWERAARMFLDNLVAARGGALSRTVRAA